MVKDVKNSTKIYEIKVEDLKERLKKLELNFIKIKLTGNRIVGNTSNVDEDEFV